MICDLINSKAKQWDREMVDQLLSKEDAQHVCAIPISRIGTPNVMVWHYTKTGDYTVRSGYHLLKSLENNNGEISRVNDTNAVTMRKEAWNGIWKAKIQNKN